MRALACEPALALAAVTWTASSVSGLYHWLSPEAYANFATLREDATALLIVVGPDYRVPFAQMLSEVHAVGSTILL